MSSEERSALLQRAVARAREIHGTVRLLDGDDEVGAVQGELRLERERA